MNRTYEERRAGCQVPESPTGLAVLTEHAVVAEVRWPLLALTFDLHHEQQQTALPL